jgi:hypothetical protein
MAQEPADRSEDIWVLTQVAPGEGTAEVRQYGALDKISPEKLGGLLNQFIGSMGKTLKRVDQLSENWMLDEVTVSVALSGELGLTLIAKVGAEGGMDLTFRKR